MSEVFWMVPASGKALWILGGIALLLIAILGLLGYIAYSSWHMRFEVSAGGLNIAGGLYGRTIPAESLLIGQAQRLDLEESREYRPRWRTNGVGLPGYWVGWFKLRNGDKALLFVTDTRGVVHIPTTESYSLLLSVTEPEGFLRNLAEAVSGH